MNAFAAVAKHLSFSRAAEELAIAQSAVSRQIALLEESLGFDLFLRGSRGVELTQKGSALRHRLLAFDSSLREDLTQDGPIRIGGLEGSISQWLSPRLLKAGKADLPRSLKITMMKNTEIQEALENKVIDIGRLS